MDEKIIQQQKSFFDCVDKSISNNKISHAYFIEKNNYSNYREVLVILCQKLLKDSVTSKNLNLINENFEYPEITLLEANNKVIKKEDILEIKDICLKKPILGKYCIYIIDGAQYLNQSSANTLLKFLEEPEKNIIGILVADNRYQVIDTIISRCNILTLKPSKEQNQDLNDEVVEFIKKIKEKQYNVFIDNERLYTLNKEDILSFFDKVENFCLNDKCDKINYDIANIIEKRKIELKYNLNIKLFVDNLVLELLEV